MESTVFCFKHSEGDLLGSSSEMSNIYCPGEFNTYFTIMKVITHRQSAFFVLLLRRDLSSPYNPSIPS